MSRKLWSFYKIPSQCILEPLAVCPKVRPRSGWNTSWVHLHFLQKFANFRLFPSIKHIFGLFTVIFGHFWSFYKVFRGYSWLFVVIHDYSWMFVVMHGHPRVLAVLYGNFISEFLWWNKFLAINKVKYCIDQSETSSNQILGTIRDHSWRTFLHMCTGGSFVLFISRFATHFI